ncbi:3-hydroxyacyl-ACP dehydratase FabZ family protein [Thermostilla marina]
MRWYWIDRFLEFESGVRAKAVKNISLAEDHLHDHFPSYPLMPAALIIEGVAQTGGLLVCEYHAFRQKVVLAKVPRAKFYFEARPGDTLTYTVQIESLHDDGAIVSATSHRGEELQAELELVFACLNGEADRELFDPGDLTHMMRILRAYDVGHKPDGSPLTEEPQTS